MGRLPVSFSYTLFHLLFVFLIFLKGQAYVFRDCLDRPSVENKILAFEVTIQPLLHLIRVVDDAYTTGGGWRRPT